METKEHLFDLVKLIRGKDISFIESANKIDIYALQMCNDLIKNMKPEEALKVVTDALKSDKGYRESWKANIAMAYIDTERLYRERVKKAPNALNGEDKNKIANEAADYFLKLLCDEIKVTEGR